MANLFRRRPQSTLAWRDLYADPFGGLGEFYGHRQLQREIERLFDEFFYGGERGGQSRTFAPSLEYDESPDHYVVRAELPGIAADDVHVEVDDDQVLRIRGEKRRESSEKRGGEEYSERSYGQFARAIQLPRGVDASKVEAEFKNGVLEVRVPKPAQAASRQIPVKAGAVEQKSLEERSSQEKGERAPVSSVKREPPAEEATRH